MPAPTNISAATAIELIPLPYTNEQEVTDAGVCYTVWYKWTGTIGSLALSIEVENATGSGSYVPDITIYESDGITEIGPPNSPIAMQVGSLAATTYYAKISPLVQDLVSARLRINAQSNPSAPIIASYILINDDGQSGWNTQGKLPGVIIDPSTGQVVNIVFPLAQGDYGDVFLNGVIALEDFDNDDIKFYTFDFNLITTVDLSPSTDFLKMRINHTANLLWVSHRQSGVTKFKSYDSAGVLQTNDDTTLSQNPQAICANNNSTIMYYGLQLSGAPLKQWDLIANVALADLVAGVGSTRISDILVMNNGDILCLHVLSGPVFVRRYNSAGVLQATYNIGTSIYPAGAVPRMGYDALAGQNAFWIWWFPATGKAQADKIQISDGTVLQTFQIDTYEEGAAEVSNPDTFGPSNSCPIIILGIPITASNSDGTLFITLPVTNGSGIYKLVPGKRNDTLWVDVNTGTTRDVKKPNPFVRTPYIGE